MNEKPVILLVDDEIHVVNALKRTFNRMDCEVLSATDPEDAISIINHSRFDIVISDYCMPGINGIDVLRHSRKVSPGAARVLMTGYSDINIAISAINEGSIFYFITKPWKTDELTSMMERAMAHKQNKKRQADMDQASYDCAGCLSERIDRLRLEYDNTKVPVEDDEDIRLIYRRDILYLTAASGEVLVFTPQGTFRSRESLSSWSKKLDNSNFFRCHRSYIVNIEKIEKISPWFNGAYNLKLSDCRDIIPVSRENKKTLKAIFGI